MEIRQGVLRLHDSLTEPKVSEYEENDNHGSDHPDDTVHETCLNILQVNKDARASELSECPADARNVETPGAALSLNEFTP
jgi:hypothetical protein